MKLRKFISGLAVGAMLVCSLAVNVFAAGSPAPGVKISDEAKAAKEAGIKVTGDYILKDGVEVSLPAYVNEIDDMTAEQAVTTAHGMFGANARVVAVFDLTVDKDQKASRMGVLLHFAEIHKASKLHFLHFFDGNWKEEKELTNYRKEGETAVEFTGGLSPVAIVVEGTSSVKTGETLPVMPFIALISVIGAAICVSKFKFAK